VHSRIDRSKCLFHCPSGGPRVFSARDNLHVAVISISVIEGIVGADRSTLILEEFISLKRKSLGIATSTSNKMYMLSDSHVAVCRSGTPPRPMRSRNNRTEQEVTLHVCRLGMEGRGWHQVPMRLC